MVDEGRNSDVSEQLPRWTEDYTRVLPAGPPSLGVGVLSPLTFAAQPAVITQPSENYFLHFN